MTELVCEVGGRVYHTAVEDLTKVEGSFFQTTLSKDWNPQSSTVLEITRNGAHFQHVTTSDLDTCLVMRLVGATYPMNH
jgi:hypothetical protein